MLHRRPAALRRRGRAAGRSSTSATAWACKLAQQAGSRSASSPAGAARRSRFRARELGIDALIHGALGQGRRLRRVPRRAGHRARAGRLPRRRPPRPPGAAALRPLLRPGRRRRRGPGAGRTGCCAGPAARARCARCASSCSGARGVGRSSSRRSWRSRETCPRRSAPSGGEPRLRRRRRRLRAALLPVARPRPGRPVRRARAWRWPWRRPRTRRLGLAPRPAATAAAPSSIWRFAFPELPEAERRAHRPRLLPPPRHEPGECLHLLRQRPPEESCAIVEVEGWENVERRAAAGRPVLILTGHCGNWELLAPPSTAAASAWRWWPARSTSRASRSCWSACAHRFGTTHHRARHPGRRAPAPRRLRSGGALGMLIDQDTKVDGVWVPFFGRPAFTPVGAAEIALRQNARGDPRLHRAPARRRPPRHASPPPSSCRDDPREATALMTAADRGADPPRPGAVGLAAPALAAPAGASPSRGVKRPVLDSPAVRPGPAVLAVPAVLAILVLSACRPQSGSSPGSLGAARSLADEAGRRGHARGVAQGGAAADLLPRLRGGAGHAPRAAEK